MQYKNYKYKICKILKKYKLNNFKIRNLIKRTTYWDNNMKKGFIYSIMIDNYIPALIFGRNEFMNILIDGKERTLAIHDFVGNEFTDINNVFFCDYTDGEKNAFLNKYIPVVFYQNTNIFTELQLYKQYNSAKGLLSPIENTQFQISPNVLIDLNYLSNHHFFKFKITIQKTNKLLSYEILLYSIKLILCEDKSLFISELIVFIKDCTIEDETLNKLHKTLNFLSETFSLTRKRIDAKYIVPILISQTYKNLENLNSSQFANRLTDNYQKLILAYSELPLNLESTIILKKIEIFNDLLIQ